MNKIKAPNGVFAMVSCISFSVMGSFNVVNLINAAKNNDGNGWIFALVLCSVLMFLQAIWTLVEYIVRKVGFEITK